jgi:hypothetical protein
LPGIGGQALLDLPVEGGDAGLVGLDASELQGEDLALVFGQLASQGVDQLPAFAAQTAAGEAAHFRRRLAAGDQRAQDRPPADPEDVTDHPGPV